MTGCLPGTRPSPETCWACFHRRPDLQSSVAAEFNLLPLYVLDQHFIGTQWHVPLPEAMVDFGTELRKADRMGNEV